MVKELKTQIPKLIELSLKQAPALTVLIAVVLSLTYMHGLQLNRLRTDFLEAAEANTKLTIAAEAESEKRTADAALQQASALNKIAEAFEKHTEVQMRSEVNMEALIRELSMLLTSQAVKDGIKK